jgi:hypothetical protein
MLRRMVAAALDVSGAMTSNAALARRDPVAGAIAGAAIAAGRVIHVY